MNFEAFVYSLGVVAVAGIVVAAIVEGSRWAVTSGAHVWRCVMSEIRVRRARRHANREYVRIERERMEEQRAWRSSWGGRY